MKKLAWAAAVLIFLSLIFSSMEFNNVQEVESDYILWEESCMREYYESKELFIFIDLTKNTLFFFKDGEQVKKYNVAIGTKENPSPIGLFRIIEKGKWGDGFGGRWMGMNVPWGVYGIHGTTKPSSIGRAASHGCIRMRQKDVIELYNMVKHGTVVEIYGGPFGAFGKSFRKLCPGDSGADVIEVQRNLKYKGYYKGYLSGYYGIDTENALNAFQKMNNLPISNIIDADMYKSLGIILTE